jgi:DNA primase catalytic core
MKANTQREIGTEIRLSSISEVADFITEITNEMHIIDIANHYGIGLDEHLRCVCLEGHQDEEPTMQFDLDNQSFYCTRPDCRYHGNAIDLIQSMEGVDLMEAVIQAGSMLGHNVVASVDGQQMETLADVRLCLREASRLYARNLDQALPYLDARGVSRSTAERLMIGSALGKDELKKALMEIGFSEATIAAAGLLNHYGDDFFRNRVMVPLRINGQVVAFYGRALNADDSVPHLRMKSDRVMLGDTPFNWNARNAEIILVEGIFDAVALIDEGFTNVVATFGTQGVASSRMQDLLIQSSPAKVHVCYDGDEAGRDAAIRDGYDLEDLGFHVDIVDLGDQDPNEFMLTHSADEFQQRISEAVNPSQWQIDRIDPDLSPEKKIEALEPVLRRCKTMKALPQAATLKRLARALGLSLTAVRRHVESLPDEASEPELLDLTQRIEIHPALDIVDNTVLMTIPQHVRVKGQVVRVPYVITSHREIFPLMTDELLKRGFYSTAEVVADRPRYSMDVIGGFLKGELHGDLNKVFWKIHGILAENVDFPDGNTYPFLTAWIVGTYLHPAFNYFPYLHFTGTKNVGKSKTMKLMSCMSFNGVMSVSITAASQFRIIESLRPTLFMDETEDLKQRVTSDKRAVLLGGYEAGSSVIRTEKVNDQFRARRLGNYGPRAFASIEGLEDTLVSRTVQITMQRSYDDQIKQREINLNDPLFQEIRDELFLVTMTDGPRIKAIYDRTVKPEGVEFGDREFNLFKPILAVGMAVGNERVEKSLIDFQNTNYKNKIVEYNNSAAENVLLSYLLEVVTKDEWYKGSDLHAGFLEYIRNGAIDLNLRVTKPFLGTLIKKLGIVSESRRSNDRKTTLYFIKVEDLRRVAENYQVI